MRGKSWIWLQYHNSCFKKYKEKCQKHFPNVNALSNNANCPFEMLLEAFKILPTSSKCPIVKGRHLPNPLGWWIFLCSSQNVTSWHKSQICDSSEDLSQKKQDLRSIWIKAKLLTDSLSRKIQDNLKVGYEERSYIHTCCTKYYIQTVICGAKCQAIVKLFLSTSISILQKISPIRPRHIAARRLAFVFDTYLHKWEVYAW